MGGLTFENPQYETGTALPSGRPFSEWILLAQARNPSLRLWLSRRPCAALENLGRQVARTEPLDIVQLLVEQVEVILFVDDERFKELL